MNVVRKYFYIAIALAMMVLSGCDNVKNVLSFPRGGPDEFSVTTNHPLAIPPDYTLRPPDANANTNVDSAGAAETLFQSTADSNTDNTERGSLTAGEEAILQHLEDLAKQRARPQAPGLSASDAISDDPVVDVLGEAKRIESGEERGTPVIDDTRTESILGNFWDFF